MIHVQKVTRKLFPLKKPTETRNINSLVTENGLRVYKHRCSLVEKLSEVEVYDPNGRTQLKAITSKK